MTDKYQALESINNFNEFSDPKHYIALPLDWSVLIAHVPNAGEAIAAGRYRDINTIGAASITAVKNVLKEKGVNEFPYVFGGDSATIVLPEEHRLDAVDALLALARMVRKNFKLTLSVGSMFIHQLENLGKTVEVARYEINSGMCIALFRGGGIALADQLLKTGQAAAIEEDEAAMADESNANVDLEGLTCRWNKIPSKNGCILTVLAYDNPDLPGNVYDAITNEIDAILNQAPDQTTATSTAHNPANIDLAKYKSMYQIMKEERRFHDSACNGEFLYRCITIIVCVLVFRVGILKEYFFDSVSYSNAIQKHADHRKFDDMLRMVIDCTQDQAHAIEFMLQDRHQHGQQLFYGVFYSTHALMTCLVDNTSDGNHIHFIDGDCGGYALAAKAMREQMSNAEAKRDRFVVHDPIPQTILEDDELSVELSDPPYFDNAQNEELMGAAIGTRLVVLGDYVHPTYPDEANVDEGEYQQDDGNDYDDNILASLEAGRQFYPNERKQLEPVTELSSSQETSCDDDSTLISLKEGLQFNSNEQQQQQQQQHNEVKELSSTHETDCCDESSLASLDSTNEGLHLEENSLHAQELRPLHETNDKVNPRDQGGLQEYNPAGHQHDKTKEVNSTHDIDCDSEDLQTFDAAGLQFNPDEAANDDLSRPKKHKDKKKKKSKKKKKAKKEAKEAAALLSLNSPEADLNSSLKSGLTMQTDIESCNHSIPELRMKLSLEVSSISEHAQQTVDVANVV